MNDEKLIEQIKEGHILSFEKLFETYSNRLYHFAYGYLKSSEEAEELVQEVFTIVWEKRSTLNPSLSFKSYIFTIAFNIIRKSFNKKSRLKNYLEDESTGDSHDFSTQNTLDYKSSMSYLFSLIEKLPPKRREIFLKNRIEDTSIPEIAKVMKISPKTVENQLTQALKFIREKLDKKELMSMIVFLFTRI